MINPPADKSQPPPDLKSLYQTRREKLPADVQASLSPRPWGLALSGGGIRSATFCFGLVKALAENRLLHRIDLLSTVSGGGYIGSTIGKLFHNEGKMPVPDPLKLEKDIGLAQTRWFAVWLRANGRYLIPRGLKDLLFATANFGRNLLGVHVELALVALILGGMLVGIDLAFWQWADCLAPGGICQWPEWVNLQVLDFFTSWPTIWIALIPVIWCSAILSCTYWALPTRKRHSRAGQRAFTAIAAAVGILILLYHSTDIFGSGPRITGNLQLSGGWVALVIALLSAWVLGIGIATWLIFKDDKDLDRIRNGLTQALAVTLKVVLGIALLGIIDLLAWLMANANPTAQGQYGGALALLAVALRATVPMISDLPKSLIPTTRKVVMEAINVAGLLLTVLLVVFWISLVHRATSSALFGGNAGLQFSLAWQYLGWLCFPPAFMVLISRNNHDFLNRSSLYAFYRARLIRSYLGAANPGRFASLKPTPRDCAAVAGDQTLPLEVTEVEEGDDVAMVDYAPHLGGGPVHLINVCVNQTRDARGGLFNQDRKGTLLTVRSGGCVSRHNNVWCAGNTEQTLSLGAWVAVSGAAVAPGLGASTRSGIAALLTIAGIRLGYWWDSDGLCGKASLPRGRKYGQLWSELRGRFDGDQRRDWFLSDGGHFENTATYALLREECEVIIVADCGADPRYAFGDLENLVRKARIDLQAEITFLRPGANTSGLPEAFGSLGELASPNSQACLALARITYRRTNARGHMLIVKPNMCMGVSVDLVNFKADNPLFPQEPTTDQSFSEAQWESYFQLGRTLGRNIDLDQLKNMEAFTKNRFVDDDGAIREMKEDGSVGLRFSSKRISSRIASTGAVSASISLGAIASVGLAGWQVVNTEISQRISAQQIEPNTFRQLTGIFGKLPPPGLATAPATTGQLSEMATELLRVGEQVCNDRNTEAFRSSALMSVMLAYTWNACRQSSPAPASCTALLAGPTPACLQDKLQRETRFTCEPTYWIRDYTINPLRLSNCWAQGRKDGVQSASDSAPNNGRICDGQTVYLQIYGPDLRDQVRSLREPWRALGASVPPIEDVLDAARRGNRRSPTPYTQPMVIFHEEASLACAKQLEPDSALTPWKVVPLAPGLKPQKGVIEVWIPPSAVFK